MSELSTYHPFVLCSFFVVLLACTMFFMHPVLLVISFVAAFTLLCRIKGKTAWKQLYWIVPVIVLSAVINPMFSHNGEHPILYVNSNAITLEAIAYGFAIGTLLATMMLWCQIFQLTMTSDAFYYLCSKGSPTFALLLSMTLRFVPLFKMQLLQMIAAQRAIGQDVAQGSYIRRLRLAFRILSMMITWALEQAIEGADAMRARGYGDKKRTTFSIYTMTSQDRAALYALGTFIGLLVIMTLTDSTYYAYYPTFSTMQVAPLHLILYSGYALFFFIPAWQEGRFQKQWHIYNVSK